MSDTASPCQPDLPVGAMPQDGERRSPTDDGVVREAQRLACLQLAVRAAPPGSLFDVNQVLGWADRYLTWVRATPDGPTPLPRVSLRAPAHARKPGR